MASRDLPDYAVLGIRVVPPPVAEEYGDGWWRIRWSVATEPADYPRNLHLPKPFPGLDGLSLVVAVLPGAPGHIVILQAIRAQYQQITIDGYTDHPILKVATAR